MHSENVTIVIPVYKRTTYFREALRSALAQTVPVEVIVVDDGTPGRPDGFQKIITEEGNRAKYIYCETNLGQAGHWNRCLEIAQTPWVSMLHDDDVLMPNAIELLLKAQQQFPNRALYFGLEDIIDENGFVTYSRKSLIKQYYEVIDPRSYAVINYFSAAGALLDRKTVFAVGGFNSNLKMTPDWDLWVRLCLEKGAVNINQITAQYREYFDLARGTSIQRRNGNMIIRSNVQYRRNILRVKRVYPDFTFPFDTELYGSTAAFSLVRTMGCHLTPRGRRIAFAYTRRRFYRKAYQASCWQKLHAACFCWSRWAYSFVRPAWMKFKNKRGFRWGPN